MRMSSIDHDPVRASSQGSTLQPETEESLQVEAVEAELERMRRGYYEAEAELSDAQGRLLVARLALRRIAARRHADACTKGADCLPALAEWALRLLEGESLPTDRDLVLTPGA